MAGLRAETKALTASAAQFALDIEAGSTEFREGGLAVLMEGRAVGAAHSRRERRESL